MSDKNKFVNLIASVELFLYELDKLYKKEIDEKDLKLLKDVSLITGITGKFTEITDLTLEKFSLIIENIMSTVSNIIKAMYIHKYNFSDTSISHEIPSDLEIENLIECSKYIQFSENLQAFNNLSNQILDMLCSSTIDGNVIKINMVNDLYLEYNVSIGRYRNLKLSYSGISQRELEELSSGRVPLDMLEIIDVEMAKRNICENALEMEINTVKISDWIRAYAVLRKIARDFLGSRTVDYQSIDSVLVIRNKKEYINQFEKFGIQEQVAKRIFKQLLYNEKSYDLLDTPILEVDGKYLLIPTIVGNISGYESMIDNLRDYHQEFEEKGKLFERQVVNFLKKHVEVETIKINDGSNNYEIDAVIRFPNNDFLIVEIKNMLQPYSVYKYNQFKNKQKLHIKQLKRNFEYLNNNKDIIVKKFKLKDETSISQIQMVLLYNCLIGEYSEKDNYMILDFRALEMYFKKEYPFISYNTAKIPMKDSKLELIFNKEFSIKTLTEFMSSVGNIQYQKNLLEVIDKRYFFNKYSFSTKEYMPVEDQLKIVKKL